MRRILYLWLPNRSRCSKQAGWRLLQGKRIIGVWWFSVITHSVVQTTLALFYRLLHVCSELSEETLPSAVLHGVYYPLCPGQLCTYITRKGHVLMFIKYLGRWGCATKWCWAIGCLCLYLGASYRLTKQSLTVYELQFARPCTHCDTAPVVAGGQGRGSRWVRAPSMQVGSQTHSARGGTWFLCLEHLFVEALLQCWKETWPERLHRRWVLWHLTVVLALCCAPIDHSCPVRNQCFWLPNLIKNRNDQKQQ